MTIAIQLTDMSTKDKQAAVYMIGLRNGEIVAENARKAALIPPEGASLTLPFSTNPEIKTSYETIFIGIDQAAHASYIKQEAAANGPNKVEFQTAFANATPQQRTAALAALTA